MTRTQQQRRAEQDRMLREARSALSAAVTCHPRKSEAAKRLGTALKHVEHCLSRRASDEVSPIV